MELNTRSVPYAITGHRPEDIPDLEWVQRTLEEIFLQQNPSILYQGMAAGVDLISAVAAQNTNTPYVATRPFAGHTPRIEDRDLYRNVVNQAHNVVIVDPSYTYDGPWLYHNRNKFMVDKADILIAVWNGKTTGGTYACLSYAKRQKKPIIYVDPVKKTVDYTDLEERLF